MVELKTYKYKLYNRDALKYLDGILVIAGRIYNHCIALHRRYYGIYHKMLNKYRLQKHLTKLKKQYPEWNEVPSQAIQDITDRIDRAYRLFFSNLKAGKRTNPLHFQKTAKYRSFTTKPAGYKFHDVNKVKIGKKDFPYWNSRVYLWDTFPIRGNSQNPSTLGVGVCQRKLNRITHNPYIIGGAIPLTH